MPILLDGRTRVSWLATVPANINLPTTTELNAGIGLEGLITPDGLGINVSTNGVPAGNLGSKSNLSRAGRKTFDISLTFHHEAVDTAWNLFPYRTTGCLAVRQAGIDKATAWTTSQPVKLYPLECGEPSEIPPKGDDTYDFTVMFFLMLDEQTRAVVA